MDGGVTTTHWQPINIHFLKLATWLKHATLLFTEHYCGRAHCRYCYSYCSSIVYNIDDTCTFFFPKPVNRKATAMFFLFVLFFLSNLSNGQMNNVFVEACSIVQLVKQILKKRIKSQKQSCFQCKLCQACWLQQHGQIKK